MRQPLLRHVSRSRFIASPPASACRRAATASIQGPRRAPIYIQCQNLAQQRRHFADGKRSTAPGPPSSEPINLGAPPPASQQSQPHSSQPSSADAESPSGVDLKQDAEPTESTQSSLQDSSENGELPSATERRRSHISKRLTNIMDNLQGNIFLASQHINDLTGYSGIEALKRAITSHEQHLQASQENVRVTRQNYKQLVADRAASQREVTTLLARKDTWTPIDLERFTSLYRSDHSNEHAVQEAVQRLADAERAAEQAASRLNAAILARYHEEQIWSDKIRRMSTWGTWGLMGVNVLLFLVFQFGFEPWRRERLTKGFEDKVLAALEKEREVARAEGGNSTPDAPGTEVAEVATQGLDLESAPADTPEPAGVVMETAGSQGMADLPAESETHEDPLLQWRQPATWKDGLVEPCVSRVQDLFSEEKVSMRKQDITLVAIEGLATGAAVAGLVVMYILRPN